MNWVINMKRKRRLTQDEVQELNDFIFCEDLKQLDLEKYKKHTKKLYYKSKKMQDENKQLKEKCEFEIKCNIEFADRIDKAIEYIKQQFVEQGGFTSYEWNDLLNDLLEILKGK